MEGTLLAQAGITNEKWIYLTKTDDGMYAIEMGVHYPGDHDELLIIATFYNLNDAKKHFKCEIRDLLREARRLYKKYEGAENSYLLETWKKDIEDMQRLLKTL